MKVDVPMVRTTTLNLYIKKSDKGSWLHTDKFLKMSGKWFFFIKIIKDEMILGTRAHVVKGCIHKRNWLEHMRLILSNASSIIGPLSFLEDFFEITHVHVSFTLDLQLSREILKKSWELIKLSSMWIGTYTNNFLHYRFIRWHFCALHNANITAYPR